jgi:DNA-binding MarR family transcriptional regulator
MLIKQQLCGGIDMIERFEQFTTAISGIHRSIQKIQRVEMAKYGLKGPHAQCLLALNRRAEGLTATQLCEICDKDKAAISRTVAELEQAGLVSRGDAQGKRYRACLKLTEQGRQIANGVDALVYRAVKQATAGYDVQQREVFIGVLSLISDGLQTICRDGLQCE